jgi:signal transduction histidine kinase
MVSVSDNRADRLEASPAPRSTPVLLRALRGVGYGLLVGLLIAFLRKQSLVPTLVYSACIAFVCWVSIDLGRKLISRWLEQRSGRVSAGWPGWRWMILIIVVGSGLGFLVGTAAGDLLTGGHTAALLRDPRQTLADLLVVLIPTVLITFFFYSRSVLADQEAATQIARRQAAEARLRLLESQLEPHMFFNTLANLHVMIGVDPRRAQGMLDQLIAFLRATLSASRATEHPLRQEFARTRDYLGLMQVRMEERLRVSFDLPAELAEIPVPPLLLQPLVENSIRHGLEPSVTGGRIELDARREGASLVITVRDTGVGIANGSVSNGTSFGLHQVTERLATQYGGRASLTLRPAADAEGGTIAVIRLPLPQSGV